MSAPVHSTTTSHMAKPAKGITLYGYFRSSTSFRVRIALALKGIAYEYKPVNLLIGEHKEAAYRAIHPQGLVPALVHNGQVVTQSMAIMEYLDDIAPDPLLVTGTAAQKARIRAMAQIIACDIHPMNNLNVWKAYVGGVLKATDDQLKDWYMHWIHQGLASYELMVSDGGEGLYSCGNQVSMADLCLLPQLYNARRFDVPLERFPRILQVEKNMLKLAAVQQALPERQMDAPRDLKPVYDAAFMAA